MSKKITRNLEIDRAALYEPALAPCNSAKQALKGISLGRLVWLKNMLSKQLRGYPDLSLLPTAYFCYP